jgi:hypothetical protein
MEIQIINLGGSDPNQPRNGNNGNYDQAGLLIDGVLVAQSPCWYSDFGDDQFDAAIDEARFVDTTDLLDTDMVSTMTEQDGRTWHGQDGYAYYPAYTLVGHNYDEAAASGCRYFSSVGAIKTSFHDWVTRAAKMLPQPEKAITFTTISDVTSYLADTYGDFSDEFDQMAVAAEATEWVDGKLTLRRGLGFYPDEDDAHDAWNDLLQRHHHPLPEPEPGHPASFGEVGL